MSLRVPFLLTCALYASISTAKDLAQDRDQWLFETLLKVPERTTSRPHQNEESQGERKEELRNSPAYSQTQNGVSTQTVGRLISSGTLGKQAKQTSPAGSKTPGNKPAEDSNSQGEIFLNADQGSQKLYWTSTLDQVSIQCSTSESFSQKIAESAPIAMPQSQYFITEAGLCLEQWKKISSVGKGKIYFRAMGRDSREEITSNTVAFSAEPPSAPPPIFARKLDGPNKNIGVAWKASEAQRATDYGMIRLEVATNLSGPFKLISRVPASVQKVVIPSPQSGDFVIKASTERGGTVSDQSELAIVCDGDLNHDLKITQDEHEVIKGALGTEGHGKDSYFGIPLASVFGTASVSKDDLNEVARRIENGQTQCLNSGIVSSPIEARDPASDPTDTAQDEVPMISPPTPVPTPTIPPPPGGAGDQPAPVSSGGTQ